MNLITELNYKMVVYIPLVHWGACKQHLQETGYTAQVGLGVWHGEEESVVVVTVYSDNSDELANLGADISAELMSRGEEAVLMETASCLGNLFHSPFPADMRAALQEVAV